jgi:3-(methylthio)propanoyl-CoA dehydrogenase
VLPIYEGTSQIQALMSMKDSLLGLIKRPGAFADQMARARVQSFARGSELDREVAAMRYAACRAQQHLMTKTAADKFAQVRGLPLQQWKSGFTSGWDPKRDFTWAMLHAERLIRIEAHTTIAELLQQQARQDSSRQKWAERWVERSAPLVQYELDRILHGGARLLRELDELRASAAKGE